MEIDQLRTICVVGAGTMGSQIAQQAALYGFTVHLVDTDEAQIERAAQSNRGHLQRRVDKGTLSAEEMADALSLVHPYLEVEVGVLGSQVVIEAIIEQMPDKQVLFQELEQVTDPQTILASNSSTIAISQIVPGLKHRDRCINLHFFHPVLVMKLVEIMRGPDTSDETVHVMIELVRRIGKEPVLINREVYGLLVNRILGAIKREAFWLAEEGFATPQDIDRAVKLGLNHPMGPFELSDFSGLDVFYGAAMQLYRETGKEEDRPPKILEDLVRAGHLGRKTGRGFYEYDQK
jgi:3-hydroxybutyryl-CoA dehydrogenase